LVSSAAPPYFVMVSLGMTSALVRWDGRVHKPDDNGKGRAQRLSPDQRHAPGHQQFPLLQG